MGFAVCHINKASGNDAGMSAHIERTIQPKNADPSRTHLNKQLIEYPDGVTNRTEAIQHRLETAGITRKIGTNQVRALRVMLSGTPEDMHRIESEGRLDEWCEDNLRWLRETFGALNVVSADLHLDEKTPHIHATIVPIVNGERRKVAAKPAPKLANTAILQANKPVANNDKPKKTYRKRPASTIRLCADDVMTRKNLEKFQDTYAVAMAKYGLQRGIKGSDARHINTPQYYRDLYAKNENLKANIELLEEEKHEIYDKVRDLYDQKDEVQGKFLILDEYARKRQGDLAATEQHLLQLRKDYAPYSAQDDLNLLFEIFPHMQENMRMTKFCHLLCLPVNATQALFKGNTVSFTGRLHSPEHHRDFDVRDAKLQLFKRHAQTNVPASSATPAGEGNYAHPNDSARPTNPNDSTQPFKLILKINGQNILDWFREQFQQIRQVFTAPQPKRGRGI